MNEQHLHVYVLPSWSLLKPDLDRDCLFSVFLWSKGVLIVLCVLQTLFWITSGRVHQGVKRMRHHCDQSTRLKPIINQM